MSKILARDTPAKEFLERTDALVFKDKWKVEQLEKQGPIFTSK